MIAAQSLVVLLAAGALALAAAGCESTQARSAKLQREGAKLVVQKGLVVHATNADVRVVRTGVVQDSNGVAVAVVLRNRSARPAVAVPLAIDVRDAHGASVFRNDAPGLDPSLTSIAFVPAHGEATWVDDQIAASGDAASVRVRVGTSRPDAGAAQARPALGAARIVEDSVSGAEIVGTVTNRSAREQAQIVVSGVVWRGARLVAAGRSIVQRLAAGKRQTYHVLPIGDPHRGTLGVAATATATT